MGVWSPAGHAPFPLVASFVGSRNLPSAMTQERHADRNSRRSDARARCGAHSLFSRTVCMQPQTGGNPSLMALWYAHVDGVASKRAKHHIERRLSENASSNANGMSSRRIQPFLPMRAYANAQGLAHAHMPAHVLAPLRSGCTGHPEDARMCFPPSSARTPFGGELGKRVAMRLP